MQAEGVRGATAVMNFEHRSNTLQRMSTCLFRSINSACSHTTCLSSHAHVPEPLKAARPRVARRWGEVSYKHVPSKYTHIYDKTSGSSGTTLSDSRPTYPDSVADGKGQESRIPAQTLLLHELLFQGHRAAQLGALRTQIVFASAYPSQVHWQSARHYGM